MAFGLKRRKKNPKTAVFSPQSGIFASKTRARARDISRNIDPINLKFRGMIQMPKTFKMTFLDFWLNKIFLIYLYKCIFLKIGILATFLVQLYIHKFWKFRKSKNVILVGINLWSIPENFSSIRSTVPEISCARACARARARRDIRPFSGNARNFRQITPVIGQLPINFITNDIISLYNDVIQF